ncbi:SMI1/KNR4 family protein [Streptomyces sp. NPDC005752]|uniref:SMI1/KNR4 family protein n=1 Tax=Streptomyces sp. NPDC005752 TaxID=3157065 RepID=UPI00340DD9A3
MSDTAETADRAFPAALAEVAEVDFYYGHDVTGEARDEGDYRIDFELCTDFESAEWTTELFRAWTGNGEVDGGAYLVFGQDGAGGRAMIWRARPGAPLADQPVVFLGSEGECGVVAGSLSDFLWVLADGYGPMEAALADAFESRPDRRLTGIAERHATTPRRTAEEIVTGTRAEFPAFDEGIEALAR